MKGLAPVLWMAVGCAEDPIIEAWHAPYEVQSFAEGTGSCEPELAPVEPDTPYVFFAASLGEPNVATLYWCEEPRNCPVEPWVSVAPVEIDLTHAEGELAGDFTISDTTCTLYWDGIVADLAGDVLTATVSRWFPEEIYTVENPSDCETLAQDAVGVECDEVSTLEAVRAEGY